jgi:hypothetical protein
MDNYNVYGDKYLLQNVKYVDNIIDEIEKLSFISGYGNDVTLNYIDAVNEVFKGREPIYCYFNFDGVVYQLIKKFENEEFNHFLSDILTHRVSLDLNPESRNTTVTESFNSIGYGNMAVGYIDALENIKSLNGKHNFKEFVKSVNNIEKLLVENDPSYGVVSFLKAQSYVLSDMIKEKYVSDCYVELGNNKTRFNINRSADLHDNNPLTESMKSESLDLESKIIQTS